MIYTTGMTLLENGIPGSVHSCAACKWILYRSALSSFSFYLYRNLSSFLCEISVYYWGETLEAGGCMWEFYIDIIGNQFFINTGWGISRLTPLYPTNSLLAAFKMAAVAPMSRISYSFTPTTIYCEPGAYDMPFVGWRGVNRGMPHRGVNRLMPHPVYMVVCFVCFCLIL